MKSSDKIGGWFTGIILVGLFTLAGVLLFSTLPTNGIQVAAQPSIAATRPPVTTGTGLPPTTTAITATPSGAPTLSLSVTRVVPPTVAITPNNVPTAVSTPTSIPTTSASPVPNSTLAITKDWKIYENLEQGFRIKYPPQFAYDIRTPPFGPEILYDMNFYDKSKYQPPFAHEFPFIGLHVLTNPQRLATDDWAKAHLFSSPGSNQYSINFQSYQIVRTLNIAGVQVARLSVTSGEGINSHVILIPLPNQPKMIDIYYHIDPTTIEPLFEPMALTLELIR